MPGQVLGQRFEMQRDVLEFAVAIGRLDGNERGAVSHHLGLQAVGIDQRIEQDILTLAGFSHRRGFDLHLHLAP